LPHDCQKSDKEVGFLASRQREIAGIVKGLCVRSYFVLGDRDRAPNLLKRGPKSATTIARTASASGAIGHSLLNPKFAFLSVRPHGDVLNASLQARSRKLWAGRSRITRTYVDVREKDSVKRFSSA